MSENSVSGRGRHKERDVTADLPGVTSVQHIPSIATNPAALKGVYQGVQWPERWADLFPFPFTATTVKCLIDTTLSSYNSYICWGNRVLSFLSTWIIHFLKAWREIVVFPHTWRVTNCWPLVVTTALCIKEWNIRGPHLCSWFVRLRQCLKPGSRPQPPHQREELMGLQWVQWTQCTCENTNLYLLKKETHFIYYLCVSVSANGKMFVTDLSHCTLIGDSYLISFHSM